MSKCKATNHHSWSMMLLRKTYAYYYIACWRNTQNIFGSCIAAPFFNSCCVCLVQGPTQSGDAAGISPTLLLPRGISPTPACCLLGPTGAAAKNPSPCLLPLPHQHATHPHGLGEGYQEHHQCIQFMQPTSLSVRSKEKCTWVQSCRQEGNQLRGEANPVLATHPANLTWWPLGGASLIYCLTIQRYTEPKCIYTVGIGGSHGIPEEL